MQEYGRNVATVLAAIVSFSSVSSSTVPPLHQRRPSRVLFPEESDDGGCGGAGSADSLLHHNCNNFSDETAHFLLGAGIPAHITGLPAEVLATPFGRALLPGLRAMEDRLTSLDQRQVIPDFHVIDC